MLGADPNWGAEVLTLPRLHSSVLVLALDWVHVQRPIQRRRSVGGEEVVLDSLLEGDLG